MDNKTTIQWKVLWMVEEHMIQLKSKERKEWDVADKLAIHNNAKDKKILICGIVPNEYNRISACPNAKVNWETPQTTHERTSQVNKSIIDNLNR